MDDNIKKYTDNKVQYERYKNIKYIFMDFSNINGKEHSEKLDKYIDFIKEYNQSPEEENVEYMLVDVTGSIAGMQGTKQLKKFIKTAKEKSKGKMPNKIALYGISDTIKMLLSALSGVFEISFKAFSTKQEALDWLAEN